MKVGQSRSGPYRPWLRDSSFKTGSFESRAMKSPTMNALPSGRCCRTSRAAQMLQASPGGRVLELSQRDRCSSSRRARYPYRHGQLRDPQNPKIKAWLARRPHYHVHFTPTSASWINQVERWFAELTRKRLQRGVHTSVRQLEADIRSFIDRHNQNPRPFKWTKSADQILASVKRFCHKAQQTLCSEL